MSTKFFTDFDDSGDDIINAIYVTQYAQPIKDLESGKAFYRADIGTGDDYKLDFSTVDNPVEAYAPGLMVHFKAGAANTGDATLTIQGSDGFDPPTAVDLATMPLTKQGNQPLVTGDISAGQVVAAIYVEDSPGVNGRFEIIGGSLSSPVPILNGGTGATTAANARTNLDVPSNAQLTSGLGTKANTSHTHPFTQVTGTVPVAQGGTGATTAAAARTALATNDAANITAGILVAARGGFGGLTANAIPKASATGAVASALSDDGTSVLSLGRKVGIGASSFVPARALHVVDAANPQQRWERTSTIYSDMQVDANGGVLLSLTGTSVGLGGTHSFGECLAAGKSSTATALGGMAVGYTASVTANYGIALGHGAISSGGIALGKAATNATFSNCMAFGTSAANTAANQVVFGSSTSSMDAIYAGKGVTNATPTAWGLKGTGGLGTNIAGGGLDLDAGAGTGTGASGVGRLRATAPGTTGTTLQTTYSNSLSWSYNKLGFYGATPVARAAAIANATDAATAISQLNLVLAALRAIGIVNP